MESAYELSGSERSGGGGLVTTSCLTVMTPWSGPRQAPLSMGFSRQVYWSGLPFPSPGNLPHPGIEFACQHFATFVFFPVSLSLFISLSVQFSLSVVSNSLWSHGLQYARLPCISPTSRACSNSCSLGWWCHLTISFSVIPFSHLQSCPASGSFPMTQFFTSGGQSIGVSASTSVLPMNIQDWFPLGLTGLISLRPRDSQERVFSNTTVQNHQFFSAQLSFFSFFLNLQYCIGFAIHQHESATIFRTRFLYMQFNE